MTRLLSLLLCCSALLAPGPARESSQASAHEQGRVEPRPWLFAGSDIPLHKSVRLGQLDNGVRTMWMRNPEPRSRSYLRLHVAAGSFAESDEERGMAHFLEHMAFNGTRRFPAGKLVEWFQENGMAFGADTNAYTGFEQTVYQLDLPDSSEARLREGLEVLRDFADGMLLAPEEVEKEKGVIDAEERERDSAGWRVFLAQMELLFGGTRYPERLPIGVAQVRARFTAESVRAFYQRWYRPENLTLVLVGDLGELDPTALFQATFGDMAVPATPRAEQPGPGKPEAYAFTYALHEREVPSVQIALERLEPWKQDPLTRAHWASELPLDVAHAMLNLRLQELVKKEGAPMLSASVGDATVLKVFDGQQLSIASAPALWRESMAAAELELRRALAHGFRKHELVQVQADMRNSLEEAVRREPTRPSGAYLEELVASLDEATLPTAAVTDQEILLPAVEALTLEQCHQALKEAWGDGATTLSLIGDLDLGQEASKLLREALEQSRSVEAEALPDLEATDFAYPAGAEAGKIARREHVEDLDVHLLVFENGVRVNLKRTEFREGQLLVRARLAEGRLTLPPEARAQALAMAADSALMAGGLEAHDMDALRRILAGRDVSVGFSVAHDHFSLGGGTTAEDLLLQLELLCAVLQHPGWRPDGLRVLQRQVPQMFEGLRHSTRGPLVQEFLPALHAGDTRFRIPSEEHLAAVTMEDLKGWLQEHLASGPLEVTLVGDMDVEAAVAVAARTLGRLPERRELRTYEERRQAPPPQPGLELGYEVDSRIPRSLVLAVFPATDGIDALRRRSLTMLAQVLDDRLRVEVREGLGAAYAPRASVDSSRVHPGVGMFLLEAESEPERKFDLLEALVASAARLGEKGVTSEELSRLREPLLNQVRDAQRQNGYWLDVLSEAQGRPAALDDQRRVFDDYRGLEAEALSALARQYLAVERASTAVISPLAPPAPADASAPADKKD